MNLEVIDRYRGRKFPGFLKRALQEAFERPLKRIKTRRFDDWYRGYRGVAWNLETVKGRHYFEIFAISCANCGQWYGWTPNLKKAIELRKKMKKLKRCPTCKGKKVKHGNRRS